MCFDNYDLGLYFNGLLLSKANGEPAVSSVIGNIKPWGPRWVQHNQGGMVGELL